MTDLYKSINPISSTYSICAWYKTTTASCILLFITSMNSVSRKNTKGSWLPISVSSEAGNPTHNVISFNHFSQNLRYFPLKFVYSTKRDYFVKITKIHYMKKHILLLGIFLNLTFSLSVQAGNTVIDSLKQEIRQAEREPSSKEKLIELGLGFKPID